jgi:hypothetical protein
MFVHHDWFPSEGASFWGWLILCVLWCLGLSHLLRNSLRDRASIFVLAALVYQMFVFYSYGEEVVLYSPNYLSVLLVILGLSARVLPRSIFLSTSLLLLFIEIQNNSQALFAALRLAQNLCLSH